MFNEMNNQITRKMYLLAKEIIKEYELKNNVSKSIRVKKELVFQHSFNNLKKLEVFNRWLNYRKEIKKTIKSQTTLNRLAKKFNNESLEKCIFVVDKSIENQYQGLFWDSYKENNTNTNLSATDKLNQHLGLKL